MEINKQLFEDVLSGKLKGTFVLRDGDKVQSHKLLIDTNAVTYPIVLRGGCYTYEGEFNLIKNHHLDIIDFIPDTIEIDPEMYSYNEKDIQFVEHFIKGYHMKENELTIEIPDDKVIDWDESKKQNKIVLKDKQLTYKDVCEKLFREHCCFIANDGSIEHIFGCNESTTMGKNNATTEHQLECILAKNKLANVAKYLNGEWNIDSHSSFGYIIIDGGFTKFKIEYTAVYSIESSGRIVFKTKEFAQQAIEILGEETVKLALEPLGI